MTHDDIIRMAREAGLLPHPENIVYQDPMFEGRIKTFAALVAASERERAILIAKNMKEELQAKFEQTYMEGVIAGATAEREACANVCEILAWSQDSTWKAATMDCAAAIRARGQE